MLFDEGYDVYLACRRGTAYSRSHETFDLTTKAGLDDYFDYNTETVGVEDIEAFVDLILATRTDCSAVQIVTHGVGAGEVLAGLAGDATLPDKVSFVTNLAPCVVPTYLTDNSSKIHSHNHWRRMLSEEQSPAEPPREL